MAESSIHVALGPLPKRRGKPVCPAFGYWIA
jgi:hypothetical protein